ncbi:MAG: hypothetical protein LBF61_11765, partial [Azoarcus sp.]|nr:hypothetical protein [Azoarcus sp.]
MTDIDLGLGDLPAENSKPANIGSFENLPSVADLAREIGYSGSLAVDAIEDRIRFYQHKTVEAALETGKFLLLLKSATKHGEFQDRVDALGFSCRSASRFMNAFMRASKNAKLLAIAHSAKNVSAFLEILTLEDDDIQNILELDDLDRLSASQLRELARKLRLDKTAAQERANIAEQRAARLERGYAVTDPRISRDLVITRAY